MTYFTSDQHFGHFNVIRLCQRPFTTAEEMDAELLARWNAKVGERDEVYIVGDLFFRAATVEPILKALHGRKHLVVGNHDHTWMRRVRRLRHTLRAKRRERRFPAAAARREVLVE